MKSYALSILTPKSYFMLLLFYLLSLPLSARVVDVAARGADRTGSEKCTNLINRLIIEADAEGGGTLFFPAGVYLTGAIEMKSKITLDLEAGAILKFSDDFEDYLPFKKIRWEGVMMNTFTPLIYGENIEQVAITGRGTLDGQGFKWWQFALDAKNARGEVKGIEHFQQLWREQNQDVEVSEYYTSTIDRHFFRPPFIQFLHSRNIRIEGVTIINSPFWTINPEFCDNIVVHGVTINNPSKDPKGPNTDGINPSSCSNVRISDCFISVGDDCITIKSGRDADGRKYGKPCENITITNCIMLAGHGGVVIGSEMSGGVKKVTISNCVFNGTDAGIRLKASRGRGGVVEEIRVDNIVMNDIQKNAFIFDLFYDKTSQVEEVTERTPVFRNIHLSNITGSNINKVGYITGIEEMPVSNISFSNINMTAREGFSCETARNIRFSNVELAVEKGASWEFLNSSDIVLEGIRSAAPLSGQPIVTFRNAENVLVNNCFQLVPADLFHTEENSTIIWGNNFFDHVRSFNGNK